MHLPGSRRIAQSNQLYGAYVLYMYSTYIYLHPPLISLSFEKVNITKYITTTTLIAYEGGGRRPASPSSSLRTQEPRTPRNRLGILWEYTHNNTPFSKSRRLPPLSTSLPSFEPLGTRLHTPYSILQNRIHRSFAACPHTIVKIQSFISPQLASLLHHTSKYEVLTWNFHCGCRAVLWPIRLLSGNFAYDSTIATI